MSSRKRLILWALIPLAFMTALGLARPASANGYHGWLVGTWHLVLDTQPFGFPENVPLRGLAVFNADGTFQMQDAGDFGQAGFTGIHSNQFGSWVPVRRGRAVGTALFLEADPATHEVLNWQKVRLVLHRTHDRNEIRGRVTVSVLPCSGMPPTALTCPDPIDGAEDFSVVPPEDIPVTFKRLRPFD